MKKSAEYKTVQPSTAEEWEKYYSLRYEVLRKPWGQDPSTTKDAAESRSFHLLVLNDEGLAVAVGRLQINSEFEAQIRSMAVREEYRGNQLGNLLIKTIEAEARKKLIKKIILDSRENAVGFYLKNGYTITGPSYLLFGVIPHFRMEKDI